MKKKGFTLIELMVVIAIIAVLAAVIAPQVFRQIAKGRRAALEAFYNSVKVAANAYYADTGFWPPNIASFTANPGGAVATTWDGPYLERWPANTPWGGAYTWNVAAAGANFCTACAVAGERWLATTAIVPAADCARIDADIDRVVNNAAGWVRYPAAGANRAITILISRDGPTN